MAIEDQIRDEKIQYDINPILNRLFYGRSMNEGIKITSSILIFDKETVGS